MSVKQKIQTDRDMRNGMGKGNILHKLREYKKRIFDIIQIGNRSDTVSLFFDLLITVVIVLNISVCFVSMQATMLLMSLPMS